MKSQRLGKNILAAEVVNISPHGLWLSVKEKEYFLPYKDYPWFRKATIDQIHNLKLLHDFHLYWPDLDVDLELESLDQPERYPLQFKE